MANKLIISHNTIATPSGRLVATMNSVSLSNAVRREYQRYFVVAPEMADILRDIAQLDGIDRDSQNVQLIKATLRMANQQTTSPVVINNDLRQRIADVLAEIDNAIS